MSTKITVSMFRKAHDYTSLSLTLKVFQPLKLTLENLLKTMYYRITHLKPMQL